MILVFNVMLPNVLCCVLALYLVVGRRYYSSDMNAVE
jgi:hypothetical protein